MQKKRGGSRPNAGRPTATEPMIQIVYHPLVGRRKAKQFRTTADFEKVVEVVEEYLKNLKL